MRLCYLLLLVLLGFSSSILPSFATGTAPLAITKVNTYFAGYEIQTNNGARNVKLTSTFTVPTVTCTSDEEYIELSLGIGHVYGIDSGVLFDVGCVGGVAYYYAYFVDDPNVPSLILQVSPGNKIFFTASENVATGKISAEVLIVKVGETLFSFTDSVSSAPSEVLWQLRASGCTPCTALVPAFTPLKTTGDKITLGSHSGSNRVVSRSEI